MKLKQKKINKIAHVQQIKPYSKKINIYIISKIVQSTSVSQPQIQEKEEEKIAFAHKYQKRTTLINKKHKQRDKRVKCQQQNSQQQQSQFIPQTIQIRLSQTKNISTSYGKMILRFIQTQKQTISNILQQNKIDALEFNKVINHFNKHMFSVSDLRKLWWEDDNNQNQKKNNYSKVLRILSMNFLRKHSLKYIFNSRIKIYDRNLKYRHKIIQGVKNPTDFNMLKQT